MNSPMNKPADFNTCTFCKDKITLQYTSLNKYSNKDKGREHSHFEDLLPRCSLSTVSLDHSTFFSVFLFRSLIVRLLPSYQIPPFEE